MVPSSRRACVNPGRKRVRRQILRDRISQPQMRRPPAAGIPEVVYVRGFYPARRVGGRSRDLQLLVMEEGDRTRQPQLPRAGFEWTEAYRQAVGSGRERAHQKRL